ncbi:MAG TPA: hypothetical protein VF212_06285 [Longimicrobiales bacterium]
MSLSTTLVQTAEDGRLTLGEILGGIPHDPAAILLYTLTAISLYLIWRANRQRPQGRSGGEEASGARPPADEARAESGAVDDGGAPRR